MTIQYVYTNNLQKKKEKKKVIHSTFQLSH